MPPANERAPGGTAITPLEVAQVSLPERIVRSQAFWPVAILVLVVIAAVAVRLAQRQSKRQRSRLKR
jgi:anti-sigma-K factor RskA